MATAWSGDWKARVRDRAKSLGFPDVLALANAHPGIPFGQLFRYLRQPESRDAPIAYAQFQAVYFEEAEQRGLLRDAIADTLVRRLRQHLRGGWNQGRRVRERKAEVRGGWELPPSRVSELGPIADRIWDTVNELNPPDDWCPEDFNDPIIQEAFARVWPSGTPPPKLAPSPRPNPNFTPTRQSRPKPKDRQKVPLPEDLVAFLGEVRTMIERGDEETTIQSDDLLQCERAYGGVTEEGGDYFSFTYFPDDSKRNKWHFTLHRSDIEMIADEALTEISLWACQTPGCGCKFHSKDETCFYCDYEDVEDGR